MAFSFRALALYASLFCTCHGGKVEVVVAHYREDLSWTEEYKTPEVEFKIYSKAKEAPGGSISLPNVGREAHTYLHHLVNNYDKLADWTVFTQGVRPSWGYHGGGDVSGHLSDKVDFLDYLRPFPDGRDSFFVLNSASQFPSGMQTNRMGFMIKHLRGNATSKDMCPPRGANGWTQWWWDKDHPQLWGKPSDTTMLEFYHRFIAGDDYKDEPLTLAFAQGARFAVSRGRALSRPREYYASLLEQLSRSVAPMEGYWMEAAWYDIFHPEAMQSKRALCDLPRLPLRQDALTIPAMQAEALLRLQEGGLLDAQAHESEPLRSLSTPYYQVARAAPAPLGLGAPFAVLALAVSGLVAPMRSA